MLLDRIPAYNNVNQWNCTVTNSREWYTWTRMGCLLLIQTHYNEPMEQPTSYLEWEGCWSFQSNQDLSTNNQEEEISHWCCLYDNVVGCFIPKTETHQFKQEYRDRTTDLPNMRATFSRRLLFRMPIFHGAQQSINQSNRWINCTIPKI